MLTRDTMPCQTFTGGQQIEIWSSRSLDNFEKKCRRELIWFVPASRHTSHVSHTQPAHLRNPHRTPPLGTEHSADIWAPELHPINNRWYIYYAAAHPTTGNKSHRMYVLGGPPVSEDPAQGQWEFLGRITGMPDTWAIDGTVFELDDGLYMMWSGWPENNPGDSDLIQQLYIQKLELPTIAEGEASVISSPEYPWEFSHDTNGAHGILEGPQFLSSPDGQWKGIVYSCAGSWNRECKLAVLHYNGGNPLDPQSWPKGQEPLLQAADGGRGPFGPGHGNFVTAGADTICVFHATDSPTDGWNNRKARWQRVYFNENGPFMGLYCGGGGGAEEIGGSGGGDKITHILEAPHSMKSLKSSGSSTGHNANEKEEVVATAAATAAEEEPAEKKAGLVARIRRRLSKRPKGLKRLLKGVNPPEAPPPQGGVE